MANNHEYIHQLHHIIQLLDKLITEKPEVLKDMLLDMDIRRIKIERKEPLQKKTSLQPEAIKINRTITTETKQIPIEEAKSFLNNNFEQIASIEEWSDAMGYSQSYFWRKFKAHFHATPQSFLIKKKKLVLINFIKTRKKCSCTEAARCIHLRDGNGLYQFVKHHFDSTPTELMNRIRKERLTKTDNMER